MEGLKNKKFKAIDWARNSRTVEGSLSVRDYKTLEPASKESNHNGYVHIGIQMAIYGNVEYEDGEVKRIDKNIRNKGDFEINPSPPQS